MMQEYRQSPIEEQSARMKLWAGWLPVCALDDKVLQCRDRGRLINRIQAETPSGRIGNAKELNDAISVLCIKILNDRENAIENGGFVEALKECMRWLFWCGATFFAASLELLGFRWQSLIVALHY